LGAADKHIGEDVRCACLQRWPETTEQFSCVANQHNGTKVQYPGWRIANIVLEGIRLGLSQFARIGMFMAPDVQAVLLRNLDDDSGGFPSSFSSVGPLLIRGAFECVAYPAAFF
jgi:hypothetical protein